MPEMQHTIKENIFFSGAGIHTGVLTNMTLKPAKENYGINFIRVDLKEGNKIKADISNVFCTQRSTSLKKRKSRNSYS
jgi:UDP-3-O-[3-hydroxymyristoyl] N-acetylglucosamine deacetylase/3-hydroxyacyl-[acyl-carrier-protein] dehydratase